MTNLMVDTPRRQENHPYRVLDLVLDSGERLPCLVESTTWFPVRVATRWAVRYRRYRVQRSTLADNLRVLRRFYSWAEDVGGFNLDDFLVAGNRLDARQIESLAGYLRAGGMRASPNLLSLKPVVDASTFDHQLAVVEDFIKWSLDSTNRGGRSTLDLEQLAAERTRLEMIFKSLRVGATPSRRIEPLEDHEIAGIRHAIGPGPDGTFSQKVFSRATQLRIWLMFEMALGLGVRRGELLKLRLDCLPRGSDDGIKVMRFPDDPSDSRAKEPAVKTAERVIPASRELLRAVKAYLTQPAPRGRVMGRSPYLFVNQKGRPISLDTADDVIADIGNYSGIEHLSWHRLRHTWAERLALLLAEQANGMDRLMYLGGWTNRHSVRHYIQRAIAKQAQESMRTYQDSLYREEEEQ